MIVADPGSLGWLKWPSDTGHRLQLAGVLQDPHAGSPGDVKPYTVAAQMFTRTCMRICTCTWLCT